jgi:DNA-binding CsgD family transcriptional regulator
MRSILRRKLVIGATVVAAAAFGGGAYAAAQQSGADSRQAFLNDVAKRLNVTPQQLKNALRGAFDDQLQAAVAAGKITQAQANALKQRAQQKGAPPLGFGGLHRFGFGPMGLIGPPHPFFFGGGGRLDAAAKYLGLTEAQLAKQLSSGKSLAQIANARGKSVSGLKDTMTAAVKTKLDKAVAAKAITSAQEQKILSALSSILDEQINRKGLIPGPHLGVWHRGFAPKSGRLFPRWIAPPPGVGPGPAGPPAQVY